MERELGFVRRKRRVVDKRRRCVSVVYKDVKTPTRTFRTSSQSVSILGRASHVYYTIFAEERKGN